MRDDDERAAVELARITRSIELPLLQFRIIRRPEFCPVPVRPLGGHRSRRQRTLGLDLKAEANPIPRPE